MSEARNRAVVTRLWRLVEAGDYAAIGALLHDEFVCDWPQSNERIRGRDNYIAVNAAYPGQWRVSIEELIATGERVVTDVIMEWERQVERVIAFYDLRDGLIVKETTFFARPYDAASWRARWVERIL